MLPGQHINLVYDNIDFGKESTTQTHATSGIIVQKKMPQRCFHIHQQRNIHL